MRQSVLWLLLACVLAGCQSTRMLQTHSDFDRAHNFASYRTFIWLDKEPFGALVDPRKRISPLSRRRILEAVEAEMRAKGLHQARPGEPADFAISYSVVLTDRLDVHSYPAPYSPEWPWGEAAYGTRIDVRTSQDGMLVIDVFDVKTHKHVWHGHASKQVTSADIKNPAPQIQAAVKAILAPFPPADAQISSR
jgi:hypothetical protein